MKKAISKILVKLFEDEARRLLRMHQPIVVAVAGSVGKTSTKLAIASVLGEKYSVLAHQSSYNGELSLPLSMFNLRVPQNLLNPLGWLSLVAKVKMMYRKHYPYEVVVLELGTDRPGDIKHFMRYLSPEIGVITAVTPEHMEGFGTMEAVLDEEFTLARGSKQVLLNASDVLLNMKKKELDQNKVRTFGVDKGNYWFQTESRDSLGRLRGTLHTDKYRAKVKLNIIAQHSVNAITAAVGAGDLLGLTQDEIKSGMQKFQPVSGRMSPLVGIKDSIIIDDSYNSSPDAAIAALRTLYDLPGGGRKMAILGSMNELGEYAKEGHANVGRWCHNLALLVSVGDEAKKYLVPAAIEAGLKQNLIKSFTSPYEAGRYLKKQLKKDDAILVKGSQNKIFTEEAIKILLNSSADQARLVRQSSFWLKRKRAQFPLQ